MPWPCWANRLTADLPLSADGIPSPFQAVNAGRRDAVHVAHTRQELGHRTVAASRVQTLDQRFDERHRRSCAAMAVIPPICSRWFGSSMDARRSALRRIAPAVSASGTCRPCRAGWLRQHITRRLRHCGLGPAASVEALNLAELHGRKAAARLLSRLRAALVLGGQSTKDQGLSLATRLGTEMVLVIPMSKSAR